MSETANSGKSKSSKNNSLTNETEWVKRNAPERETKNGGG